MSWYIDGLKVVAAFFASFLMLCSMVGFLVLLILLVVAHQQPLYLFTLIPWSLLWGVIPKAFGKIMDWSDR